MIFLRETGAQNVLARFQRQNSLINWCIMEQSKEVQKRVTTISARPLFQMN